MPQVIGMPFYAMSWITYKVKKVPRLKEPIEGRGGDVSRPNGVRGRRLHPALHQPSDIVLDAGMHPQRIYFPMKSLAMIVTELDRRPSKRTLYIRGIKDHFPHFYKNSRHKDMGEKRIKILPPILHDQESTIHPSTNRFAPKCQNHSVLPDLITISYPPPSAPSLHHLATIHSNN